MRPANIITAVSDILAGITIAIFATGMQEVKISYSDIVLLIISTAGLYGGGVVMNDYFDAAIDRVERPERPIPSGLISENTAALGGTILLIAGIMAASMVHPEGLFSPSTWIAAAIAIAALVYDKWGKHHFFIGPLNMGLCRGLNLLLGISMIPSSIYQYWFLCFVPVVYIAAITMISRGEVYGGKKTTMYGAVALYFLVILSILFVALYNNTAIIAVLFLVIFAAIVFPPLLKAMKKPSGPLIGKAVKSGVIGLIAMNASWAASFDSVYFALMILLLLPVSIGLAKVFAVT